MIYDFYRLQKVKKNVDRRSRYDKKLIRFKWKLRDSLSIGELAYVLTECLKKKDVPGRLYKSTTENKLFFNKDEICVIQKMVKNINGEKKASAF